MHVNSLQIGLSDLVDLWVIKKAYDPLREQRREKICLSFSENNKIFGWPSYIGGRGVRVRNFRFIWLSSVLRWARISLAHFLVSVVITSVRSIPGRLPKGLVQDDLCLEIFSTTSLCMVH